MAENRKSRAWPLLAVGGVVALAVIVPLLAAVIRPSTAGETQDTPTRIEPAPAAAPAAARPAAARASGKELFMHNCAVCHTLSATGVEGFGGPNLDKLKPSRRRVLAAIRRGGSGYGIMPPDLVVGAEAERVARFVARATHG
jgi:mono/diheme cytochrome c family protein